MDKDIERMVPWVTYEDSDVKTVPVQPTPLLCLENKERIVFCSQCGAMLEPNIGLELHSRFHGFFGYYRISYLKY